jgi:hypothetical protein
VTCWGTGEAALPFLPKRINGPYAQIATSQVRFLRALDPLTAGDQPTTPLARAQSVLALLDAQGRISVVGSTQYVPSSLAGTFVQVAVGGFIVCGLRSPDGVPVCESLAVVFAGVLWAGLVPDTCL